jgi:3-oxoacyl-[acyl-carrier-protein] synthase II
MELKRAVVTGLGAITPIGNTVKEFWHNALAGVSGSAPITLFDITHFKTRFACEVKGFEPEDHFERKEARKMDRFAQFAMVAADEAIKDSAFDLNQVNRDRVGVIWASGIGGNATFQEQVHEYATGDGRPRFSPFFIPKIIIDIAAGIISIKYGFRGVNFGTVSACASSTHAIIDAFNYIRLGKADIIVSGGSEAPVTAVSIGGFGAMKALSTNNENPASASRPCDIARDGFVAGEGAGALIIEEYEHARRRGARIYAEVIGGGLAADAYHMTATHPDGDGAYISMKTALDDAGLAAGEVRYLNPHSTSTPVGDTSEIKAVSRLFGESVSNLAISATKSMTGHLLGAAGAVEGIICIKAIEENSIPPTINTTSVDPAIPGNIDLTLAARIERDVDCAMSNTFGFGGHCATALFRKLRD